MLIDEILLLPAKLFLGTLEKIKEMADEQMLMNLSCLTPKNRVPELAGELDRINGLQNFSVKFTGPWPAYSFMA